MGRLRGIDGLKGLSILAILGYHLFGPYLPGGFIGIEVFFTISGFLTARSLLFRLNSDGKIGLGHYYAKRMRRIIPPVWFVTAFFVAFAWAVDAKDALVGVKGQVVAVATFTYNWHDIAAGVDYFAATGPQLFKHLWFISLLMQFYVLAPLLIWLLWKFLTPVRAAAVLFAVSFASAIAMGLVFTPGTDPTRAYFGTDTHCFGLLIGVALAFMMEIKPGDSDSHRFRYAMIVLLGGAALVGVVDLGLRVIRQDASAFRGGLLLVALLTDLIIVGCVVPGSWLGQLLDFRPLAALGKYSYGVYLWHWPLQTMLLFLIPQWRSAQIPYVGIVTLALTALTAWGSYKCIEQPLSRQGFFHSLIPDHDGGRNAWIIWGATVVVILLSVAGCVRGIQEAPKSTQTQLLLQKYQHRAPHPQKSQKNAPTDSVKGVTPAPIRQMPGGDRITAIGDSVMVAIQPALEAQFPGIFVNADVSRSFNVGLGIAQSMLNDHTLREYVVVGLSTNAQITAGGLDQLLSICGPGRVLVLINGHGNRSWIPPTNTAIAQFVDNHSDQVILVDWNAVASANEVNLYPDDIHPKPGEGEQMYVSALNNAIAEWIKKH